MENKIIQDLLRKLRNSEINYRSMSISDRKILVDYCLKNQHDPECLNILGCASEDREEKKKYFEKAGKMGNEFGNINYISKYCDGIYEKVYKLQKLNPKSDYGKFFLAKYLGEIKEYEIELEYLLNINSTFYEFNSVMWSIFLCYKEIGDLDLSLFYLVKCMRGYIKNKSYSDIEECLSKLKDFNDVVITNIPQKTIIYITNFFSSILNVNVIEIIMEYFGVEVN